jgi:hypothetical protein
VPAVEFFANTLGGYNDLRDGFGAIVVNPTLSLKPGMPLTLTVKVLAPPKK